MKSRGRRVHRPPASPTVANAKSIAPLGQEITESQRADLEFRRMSRALLTISQCNRAVVRAQNEQESSLTPHAETWWTRGAIACPGLVMR